jgi:predicted enzyme related to lactoylglutathione lyase
MSKTHPTLGNGKICYLEIPALDIAVSSNFYHQVFGWHIRKRSDGTTAFDDGVNEVSGAWKLFRAPSTTVGVLTYIMVDSVAAAIELVQKHGGKIVTPVGMDYPEVTARFSDPAGNVFGLFQQ